jgi:hypothetical protein
MEREKPSEKKISWSNPHSDQDYEYVNSASRSPWPGTILYLILGIAVIFVGWRRYNELVIWQQSGNMIKMHAVEKLCYELAGIWLFPSILALIGLGFIAFGIKHFRHKQQLKK